MSIQVNECIVFKEAVMIVGMYIGNYYEVLKVVIFDSDLYWGSIGNGGVQRIDCVFVWENDVDLSNNRRFYFWI